MSRRQHSRPRPTDDRAIRSETPPFDVPPAPETGDDAGNLQQLARTLSQLAHKIETTEAQLQRHLRHLGQSAPSDRLAETSIPAPERMAANPYLFQQARRARNTQSQLQSLHRRYRNQYRRYLEYYREHQSADDPTDE